jgi:hypothetical protein
MVVNRRIPWAVVFGGGIALLAAAPFFRAPFAALSIDALPGRALYAISLIMLVVGMIVSEWRGNTRRDNEIRELLRFAAESAASGTTIVEQNNTTHTLLLSLYDSYERKDAFESSGRLATPTPSIAGQGAITLTPGTGELVLEGFAPTITLKALDQEIREKEAAVLSHLAEDESGSWMISAQIAAHQHNAQLAAQRAAAVQMQNVINSGNEDFPSQQPPTDKKGEPLE